MTTYTNEHLTDLLNDEHEKVKQLEQELAKVKEDNEKLSKELFNQREHYDVLKENYDNAFIFMTELTGNSVDVCFDKYKDWLIDK